MKRAYRARWGRIAMFWVVCFALVWGLTQLWSCAPAYSAEWEDLGVVHKTLIAEAGGEGVDGMQAVANVIRNRAVKRGLTVEEVCLQRWQFSAWNGGRERVDRMVKREKGVWDDALTAWQLSGVEDITSGADHYYAEYIPMPKWAKSMRFTGKVGKHLFYASK